MLGKMGVDRLCFDVKEDPREENKEVRVVGVVVLDDFGVVGCGYCDT